MTDATKKPDGGRAFPAGGGDTANQGMSLRDYFAAAALSNALLCTGEVKDWQLVSWFGKDRAGVTRAEIVARQASDYADAMLAQREKP